MNESFPAIASFLFTAAVLVCGTAAGAAETTTDSRALPVSISASFTSVEIIDAYTCRGGNPTAPAPTERPQLGGYGYCAYTSHGSDAFWGDLDGSTTFGSGGVVHANGAIPYSSVITFTGSVSACGSGTFTFQSDGTIQTMVLGDDGNYHDVGPWAIESGSGTDGLAGIAGSGTVYTTIPPDFSSAWGTLTGTVTCP